MSRNLGLSNIYLGVGAALIAMAVIALVAAFVVPSEAAFFAIGQIAGFCFVSGAVLYVIGRIARVRRPGAQA
ncbi:hypothetical protein [Pseudoxanthomonas sp. PXM02]|uniref:hypothetical protein n=1 Tax=Pseudoxanthomonas sp. PXM02 TaxID=2769294 RepID=UPI0017824BD6|nr:hypothetical protein [Pseudoxanthomonas sp. PXM02]MBD9480064.1 hypothetical protein [Pseudoxanthomonas sp. PXM02]